MSLGFGDDCRAINGGTCRSDGGPKDIARDDHLHAAVLLPARGGTVVGHRVGFAITHSAHILLRDTLEILTSFGDGGRQPGQFYAVHSIATDSKGNIFTTETYRGQRVQKFVYKGIGTVAKPDRESTWPKGK